MGKTKSGSRGPRGVASSFREVGVTPPVLFAGGVAHNPCIRAFLEESLGVPLVVPEQPDLVGALGAALYGMSTNNRQDV